MNNIISIQQMIIVVDDKTKNLTYKHDRFGWPSQKKTF